MAETKRESTFNILLLLHSQASRIHFSSAEKVPQHLQYIITNVQSKWASASMKLIVQVYFTQPEN